MVRRFSRLSTAVLVAILAGCVHGSVGVSTGGLGTSYGGAIGVGGRGGPEYNADNAPQHALKMADEQWPTRIAKCSGSYFTTENVASATGTRVYEYKDVSFAVWPEQLTDVDERNRVEWKGFALMTAASRRWQQANGTWSDWEPAGEVAKIALQLIRGRWFTGEVLAAHMGRVLQPPPECPALPSGKAAG
jgi:hypothetical protein